jgi:hypothetical protein
MTNDAIFTSFKSEILTDGKFGKSTYYARNPLGLLEHAVNLALVSESPDAVKAMFDKTSAKLLESLSKKRRKIGDVVQLDADSGWESEHGTYRIASLHRDGSKASSDTCVQCANPECREWPLLEQVDNDGTPTGEHAYHVPECRMADV